MLHAHKELLIRTDSGNKWEHLDILRIKHYGKEKITEFVERCFVGKFEGLTTITQLDQRFLVPDDVFDVRNIPNAKRVWDCMMVVPFDVTFGQWPWDYADFLDDPLIRKSMEEYDVLDARLILMM